MTTKEKLLHAVEDLPDDATIEDAMERLLFLAKIERGVRQADAGQTIPHSAVREGMAKWLKRGGLLKPLTNPGSPVTSSAFLSFASAAARASA